MGNTSERRQAEQFASALDERLAAESDSASPPTHPPRPAESRSYGHPAPTHALIATVEQLLCVQPPSMRDEFTTDLRARLLAASRAGQRSGEEAPAAPQQRVDGLLDGVAHLIRDGEDQRGVVSRPLREGVGWKGLSKLDQPLGRERNESEDPKPGKEGRDRNVGHAQ